MHVYEFGGRAAEGALMGVVYLFGRIDDSPFNWLGITATFKWFPQFSQDQK